MIAPRPRIPDGAQPPGPAGPDPRGFGVDADHDPGGGLPGPGGGEAGDLVGQGRVGDGEVVHGQGAGLVDHHPGGDLADRPGPEQLEHHRQAGVALTQAHPVDPLVVQRRDLRGLRGLRRPDHPIQRDNRLDPHETGLHDRQRLEVVRQHLPQQVSGRGVLEHASTLEATTDTNVQRSQRFPHARSAATAYRASTFSTCS
jgi:hypothetical protein